MRKLTVSGQLHKARGLGEKLFDDHPQKRCCHPNGASGKSKSLLSGQAHLVTGRVALPSTKPAPARPPGQTGGRVSNQAKNGPINGPTEGKKDQEKI